MFKKKKIEVVEVKEEKAKKVEEEVVEEQVVEVPHVVVHTDRLDSGTNHKVSEALPSLDD